MFMVFTELCICISKCLEFILKVGIYCQGDEKERDRTSDICIDSGLFGLFIAYVSTKEKGVQRTKNKPLGVMCMSVLIGKWMQVKAPLQERKSQIQLKIDKRVKRQIFRMTC